MIGDQSLLFGCRYASIACSARYPPIRIAMIDIDHVAAIVRDAGERILEVARRGTKTREKGDGSPVTNADEAAHRLIVGRLRSLTPDIPVVSEESAEPAGAGGAHWFWLVDPLDGTREFINGNDEYTVNVALVEAGAPVLGVVLAPARGVLYGGASGEGAWCQYRDAPRTPIAARSIPETGPVAAVSRSHSNAGTDAWLAKAGVTETVRAGSSLKFCLIAEGAADVYPRLGRTMEWDTAAAHAVLSAAGGFVSTLAGSRLTYGKPGLENPHFIARGRH